LDLPLLRARGRGPEGVPRHTWHPGPSRDGGEEMLIPSIDLQGRRIVQLVQGERLAIESSDIDGWIERFRGRRKVQLIDLDAAKQEGSNDVLVQRICSALPCRVGGGIRSLERAQAARDAGATQVIVGSALFASDGIDLP